MIDPITHPSYLSEDLLLSQCEVRRQRRSGPGGQHRNKVETGVIVTHLPTGIKGEATERRSQNQNRQVAIFRLRTNLALHHRTPATDSCEAWQGRTRSRRIEISASHYDYPMLLAHALNVLSENGMRPSKASFSLNVSTSQLIRLFRKDPSAFQHLNQLRKVQGLPPIR